MALLFEDKVYLKHDLLKRKIFEKISLAKYDKKNRSTIQLLHIYIHTNIHIYLKHFGKSKIEQNRVYKTFKTLHYAVKEKNICPLH